MYIKRQTDRQTDRQTESQRESVCVWGWGVYSIVNELAVHCLLFVFVYFACECD